MLLRTVVAMVENGLLVTKEERRRRRNCGSMAVVIYYLSSLLLQPLTRRKERSDIMNYAARYGGCELGNNPHFRNVAQF